MNPLDVVKEAIKDFTKNPMRNDSTGLGHFGASRGGGTRKHKGKDYEVEVGEDINSPVVGKVTKIGYPYGNDLSYRYVQVTDIDGNNHRMFYVAPDEDIKLGASVSKGTKLGVSQDLSRRHGEDMKNHIHYEILDSTGKAIDRDEFSRRRVAGTAVERQGKGEQT